MTKIIRCQVVLMVAIPLACTVAFAQSSGSATYQTKCQMCHGATGAADSLAAKMLKVLPLTDPEMKMLTADAMIISVKNGKGKMPSYRNYLTDAEIMDAVAYFRELGTRASAYTPSPEPAPETAQSSEQAAVPENYFSKASSSHLILFSDGSSIIIDRDGQRAPGHWSTVWGPKQEGSLLTVEPSGTGHSRVLKVQDDNLIDRNTGEEWVRMLDASANAPEAASAPPPPPPPSPMPEIAPPPPPADATPPTIALSQTIDQVTSAFGQPQRKAAAGPKEIFFYTDLKMKVTFTNGKVSSIE